MSIHLVRSWLCACVHLVSFISPATSSVLWHSRSAQSSSVEALRDVGSGILGRLKSQDGGSRNVNSTGKLQPQLLPGAGLCGTKIANPPDAATMDCPKICPFIRPDTAHFCSFTCVKKEDCDNRSPLTSFADPMTHVCSPCTVPGCLSCGATRNECTKCNNYLVLTKDGHCLSEYRHAWAIAYWVVAVVFTLIVLYVVCLALRPTVNTLALERAEDFRAWSKLSHRSGETSRPYPLDTNLCTENVAGAGVMLHFGWQRAVIVWAIIVTIVLFILSRIVAMVPDDMHPNDGDVFASCAAAGSEQVVKELKKADQLYLYFTFGIYVFSTIGSLLLFVQHRYLMRRCDDSDKLFHYAMSAEGFPPCSGEQGSEQKYKEFFENACPGTKIIGVSIAWDISSTDLKLDSQVELELDKLDRERDTKLGKPMTPRDSEGTGSRGFGSVPANRCCHLIDDLILSAFTPDTEGCVEGEDLSKKLENMTSTGTVFVVFQTRSQRNEACNHKTLEYDGSTITLKQAWHDPETMLWENRRHRSGLAHKLEASGKFAMCVGGLFTAVTLWAILVYHPVSSYLLTFSNMPGLERAHWWDQTVQALLLSIPIMISNQILYQVCAALASWMRFHSTGSEQLTYVVMYTVFVSYQTILDVGIVIQTAFGHHTDSTLQLARASGVLGSKAIAQNPSIRDTLYLEMVAYLYPGTLLIPYLLEPIGLGICQYQFFKWIIRSRSHIGIQTAENLLVALPYDLTRYGDILISTICCVLLCFIATPDVYQVFLYLLAMLVFCYVWDHWRVLRLAPRFFEDNNKLDNCVIMMLSIPCGLLAAAVVFRKYGAQEDLYLTRQNAPMWCVFYFFIHVAFHLCAFFLIIAGVNVHPAFVSDQEENKGCSYENVAGDTPYNWFNTNHVHCLRSKYIHKDDTYGHWCIPMKPGREYLIEKAPELGLFYEAREIDHGHDRSHLLQLFNEKTKKLKEVGGAAAKRASNAARNVRSRIISEHPQASIPEEDDQSPNSSPAKSSRSSP